MHSYTTLCPVSALSRPRLPRAGEGRGLPRVCSPPRTERFPSIRVVTDVLVREVSLVETRPLRQAVLRPHETLETVAASESASAFAVGAFDRKALIAVGLVAPDGEPGAWRVRGMATAPHARGNGAGTAVLDALLRHATARGALRVWCNARVPARSLYERAGFHVTSEEFELPEIGPHLVMERKTAA
jgi:ribosomal protein S18 acetylase RimI-like enzyme